MIKGEKDCWTALMQQCGEHNETRTPVKVLKQYGLSNLLEMSLY